jgi:NADH:ubiquinone oxidoreductase subunit 6 (subunit J)
VPFVNTSINIFFVVFHGFIFFCAFKVVSNRNPIYALLNLIIIVILSALFLYMSGAIFLSYLLILVYVGAVIVLFLFVVKMFNLRHIKENLTLFNSLSKHLIACFVFIIINMFFLFDVSNLINNFKLDQYIFQSNVVFDIDTFVLVYTEYVSQFILITLILFTAMVGSIFTVLKIDQQPLYTR